MTTSPRAGQRQQRGNAVDLTPVQQFGNYWAKREDFAGFNGHQYPSGAKVRQYLRMVEAAPADAVLMVGCSADSAMQIYVAYAAELTGRKGYVVIPSRKQDSAATRWALDHGAIVSQVTPGYPSVYRARMRELAKSLGLPVVRWDFDFAFADNASQVDNLPAGARVVVPTGSGLTAASILAAAPQATTVLAVAVSDLASKDKILATANKYGHAVDPDRLEVVRTDSKYGKAQPARLPDGTALDPFYAAKALPFVQDGDVLWVSGRRP